MVKLSRVLLIVLPVLASAGRAQTVTQQNLEQGAQEYTWSTPLESGKRIYVDLKLTGLFTVGAEMNTTFGTDAGIDIDLTTVSGLAPNCQQLQDAIEHNSHHMTGELSCTLDHGSKQVNMGKSGVNNRVCRRVTVPVYREETVCDEIDICEPAGDQWIPVGGGRPRRPACPKPRRPICRKIKVLDHNKIEDHCEETYSRVVYEVDDFRAIPNKPAVWTYTSILSLETVKKKFLNNVLKETRIVPNTVAGMDLDIEIPFSLQLHCASTLNVSPSWSDLSQIKHFTYNELATLCPQDDIRLASDRSVFLERGQLILKLDKTNLQEGE